MGLRGFCFPAIKSRSGTPNILLGLNGMTQGPVLVTRVFMGSVFLPSIPDLAPQTSRWGATGCFLAQCWRHGSSWVLFCSNRFQIWHSKHPVGAQQDDSGPSVGNTGLHGFCFPAINSRSGKRIILLGLNGMILGPVLATRVFMGSVFLSSIPDLALQTSRWGSTG